MALEGSDYVLSVHKEWRKSSTDRSVMRVWTRACRSRCGIAPTTSGPKSARWTGAFVAAGAPCCKVVMEKSFEVSFASLKSSGSSIVNSAQNNIPASVARITLVRTAQWIRPA